MKIDIWSDIVCPFCYIGSTQFTTALQTFAHKAKVTVTYHSFELDPSAPKRSDENMNEMLARKKGMPLTQARALNQQVAASAAAVGLRYDLDHAKPANSFDAHRLIHFAAAQDKHTEMLNRLYAAYFTEAQTIADHAALVRLAVEVGLDAKAVQSMLRGDDYTEAVRADIAQAAAYGIHGVPFFVFDDIYAVSGAQGTEVFNQVLQKTWHKAHPLTLLGGNGEVCQNGLCLPVDQLS